MAEKRVEELTKARRALVDQRQSWAQVLARGYERGKTEDAIKGIIQVQNAIEAIDSAIDDERSEWSDDDEGEE